MATCPYGIILITADYARERVSGLMEKLKKKSQGKTGIIRDPGK